MLVKVLLLTALATSVSAFPLGNGCHWWLVVIICNGGQRGPPPPPPACVGNCVPPCPAACPPGISPAQLSAGRTMCGTASGRTPLFDSAGTAVCCAPAYDLSGIQTC